MFPNTKNERSVSRRRTFSTQRVFNGEFINFRNLFSRAKIFGIEPVSKEDRSSPPCPPRVYLHSFLFENESTDTGGPLHYKFASLRESDHAVIVITAFQKFTNHTQMLSSDISLINNIYYCHVYRNTLSRSDPIG